MALRVRFVENLHDIVDPVVGYLTQGSTMADLFAPQHLIVPTAGVRAWLAPQVAARLGATAGNTDGVLANVRIGYIGMLNGLLRGGLEDEDDAWSIERVTMAVLRVIHGRDPSDPLIKKHGGHLRAARAIADRFDRYAARRPALIREWEDAHRTNDEIGRDNAQAEWQYELWRRVRDIIGVPSWPARTRDLCDRLASGELLEGLPSRLMVAGVETLSVPSIDILRALGTVIDVEVIGVHPSAHLWGEWDPVVRALPVTPGVAPQRADDAHVVVDRDVLVTTWLRGAFELQALLASQGLAVDGPSHSTATTGESLLARMQAAVARPHDVRAAEPAEGDMSFQVHRAHNLARQVDILRDAVLHAFHDLPDLRPHEVLVMCADVEAAAPFLTATFDQPVTLADGRKVRVPLVVADRSLRDVSPGADLLAAVLGLIGSRFDVSSVLAVASHDLVMRHLRIDTEDVEVWQRLAEVTRVRWGLDPGHRSDVGLRATEVTAHTWKQMLDRALLGALLPDAETPAHELGGVVPLIQVDSAETDSITALADVLGVLANLENRSREGQPVRVWCDHLEEVLVELCGSSCTELDDALGVIQQFRDSTTMAGSTGPSEIIESVSFGEFADLLVQKLSTSPGRQPLRTGAVTATSFVPLRAVPFRVVCIVGLDDGTLAVGEAEGDDIVANDPLMGDPDARIDARRVLLDAVTAAQDRLIVTCIGRSIKNNSHVPLVTPLAELLDLCGRLGIDVPDDPEKLSSVEHLHPRHASGRSNFVADGGPVPDLRWSHDAAALSAARGMFAGSDNGHVPVGDVSAGEPFAEVPLTKLEAMVTSPLQYYLRESLRIYVEGEAGDEGAVLPVDIDEFALADLAAGLVSAAGGSPIDDARQDWEAVALATDTLPAGGFARGALDTAFSVATAVRGAATDHGAPLLHPDPIEFKVRDPQGTTVDCHVPNVVEAAPGDTDGGLVYSVLYHTKAEKEVERLALRLLALRAAGRNVGRAVVVQRDTVQIGYLAHVIELDPAIDTAAAASRLCTLARIEPVARVVPCPEFGNAADEIAVAGTVDSDDAMDGFEDFVETPTYANSREFIVFGGSPEYENVFPDDDSAAVGFHIARNGAFRVEKDGGKKDGLQKWVVK